MQRSIKVAFLLLFALPVAVLGQNYINNPYTRFAIGDLQNYGFSYNKFLGGSSIGLRPTNQINYLNPASYTSQDTLSFIFMAGVSGKSSFISTEQESDNVNNINLDYFAMGFPITKWWKFSLGLVPFSRTQYHFRQYYENYDDLAVEYKGTGGFNEFYFGTGIQIAKILSLGVNAAYLFGDINRVSSVDVPNQTVSSTKITEDYIADDFYFKLGLQLHPYFIDKNDKKHTLVLGATYDFQTDIDLEYNSITNRNFPSRVNNPYVDTFNIIDDSLSYLSLPAKLGLGLSYNYDNQWMFTLEYSIQNFSEGIGPISDVSNLADYSSIRFGTEFVPTPMTDRKRAPYHERMHYRLGGHYTKSYLSISNDLVENHQLIDYGISVGVGLPWRNPQKLYTYTTFNLNYEFGVRGTTDFGLIRETYHMVTIGISLHDYWFNKPKYD